MCKDSIIKVLSHKTAKFGKSLPLIFIICLISSCLSEPWGKNRDVLPERTVLLAEIDLAREKGRVMAETTIESYFPDRELMQRQDLARAAAAERGEISVASAAWWGWDETDSTVSLQRAFSSRVDVLVVPAMDGAWKAGPLFLDGPKHLILDPGSEIAAVDGGFRHQRGSLLTLYRQSGIRISGYGASLRMNREAYSRKPYEWSQWRHALTLLESQDIRVEGLSIEDSGGDGIYMGQKKGGFIPRNIHLKDLYLLNNYRQGVSVISADGFLMESCYISGSRGTPPMAAIDFEPNKGLFGLINCTVSHSLFEKNGGAALTVHLPNVTDFHPTVSITIRDTVILGYPLSVWIHGMESGAAGTLSFINCQVSGFGIIGHSKNFTVIP